LLQHPIEKCAFAHIRAAGNGDSETHSVELGRRYAILCKSKPQADLGLIPIFA
jgi:hypothetical protein